MADRIHHGLVSFDPAGGWMRLPAWVPNKRGARPRPHPNCLLRSPRGYGAFEVSTIAMPEDMGSFDVDRLRRLLRRSLWPRGSAAPFDEVAGTKHGIACVAHTTVIDRSVEFARKVGKELSERVPMEDRALFARYLSAATVRRDWYMASGSEMANVWYRGPRDDAVAADLVDAEDMVRSIRFGSALPLMP